MGYTPHLCSTFKFTHVEALCSKSIIIGFLILKSLKKKMCMYISYGPYYKDTNNVIDRTNFYIILPQYPIIFDKIGL